MLWFNGKICAVILIATAASVVGQWTDTCPENEEYDYCGTACPRTCKNWDDDISCIQVCKEGCFCIDGYVRNDDGKCVRPEQCTNTCPKNEEYKDCGTACPQTCGNFWAKIKCIAVCRKGCFCKAGYVRNSDGKCVKPEQCVPSVCPKNEVYQECGTLCPRTCDNFWHQIRCKDGCKKGCFCKAGYVRNDDGDCVKPEQCLPDLCPENEEYDSCGTACPRTCSNRDTEIYCIQVCREGCFCKAGFIRNDDGKCVKPEQCPPSRCPKNDEYNDCGTACPKTCKNFWAKIKCTADCRKGCFCKSGYVRNIDGKCVKPEQCVPSVCPVNEEYQECGTLCPRTCGNYGYQIKCVAGCKSGCFCKDGFVRNDDDVCVKPDQCVPAKCPRNEEYQECGTLCPRTCDNWGYQIRCIAGCNKGCFCKDGYIRNDDGVCVKPEQCVPGGCPDGEVYTACASPCNDCILRGNCDLYCDRGCDCRQGYYRDEKGVCIPESSCPTSYE